MGGLSREFEEVVADLKSQFDRVMSPELAFLGRLDGQEIAAIGGVLVPSLIKLDPGLRLVRPPAWRERLGALVVRPCDSAQTGASYLAEAVWLGTRVTRGSGARLIYLDDHEGLLPAGMVEYGNGHVVFHQIEPHPDRISLEPEEPSEFLIAAGFDMVRYNPPASPS